MLIAQIAPKLTMHQNLGLSITTSYIDKVVDDLLNEFKSIPDFEFRRE